MLWCRQVERHLAQSQELERRIKTFLWLWSLQRKWKFIIFLLLGQETGRQDLHVPSSQTAFRNSCREEQPEL